jgi:hypothetical protein
MTYCNMVSSRLGQTFQVSEITDSSTVPARHGPGEPGVRTPLVLSPIADSKPT